MGGIAGGDMDERTKPILGFLGDLVPDDFFPETQVLGKMCGISLGTYSAYIMTKATSGTSEMETSE